MENLNNENQIFGEGEVPAQKREKDYLLPASIIISALIIGGSYIYGPRSGSTATADDAAFIEEINNITVTIPWEGLGKKLIESGIIDPVKFEALYAQRGQLDDNMKKALYGPDVGTLEINMANSGVVLNLLWALGLANKNDILEKGPMVDRQYGGDAGRFASTGGWTLAVGNPMDHYSHHPMIPLTREQQSLVESISKNIYRPCCGNSVHFPDCNHGMAMLGLIELLASEGFSEDEMYEVALKVNSLWFPDTYATINKYLEVKGTRGKTDPKEILGANFSSGAGYQKILSEVSPSNQKGGGSCSV